MITAVVITFIIGYVLIVFEHSIKLDKTVPALLMAAICWALISTGNTEALADGHMEAKFDSVLLHHLGKTAEILIFLIGAMTIVEIVDLHNGFNVIKKWINTKSKTKLLWIVCTAGFVLSAIIDNLTATIVLVNILRKLVYNREERIWYVSLIVIAANAGGAPSPIGDVTTTMLWIGEKVSTLVLLEKLLLPSLVAMLLPTFIASKLPIMQGNLTEPDIKNTDPDPVFNTSTFMFILGMSAIVFVPVFKGVTHLPPYMGMMLSLGIVWLISEYLRPKETYGIEDQAFSAHTALSRIEFSSILFFLGILMAVGAMESLGVLSDAAEWLNEMIPITEIVIMLLGIGSAIIDNVPLVAASMGMYMVPMDHEIWHLIAFAAGTGGSMLIIGSAAGVAAMGLERISFIWYIRNITWLAAIGFLAGYILLWIIEVGTL